MGSGRGAPRATAPRRSAPTRRPCLRPRPLPARGGRAAGPAARAVRALVGAEGAGVVLMEEGGGRGTTRLEGGEGAPDAMIIRLERFGVPPEELVEPAVLDADSDVPMGVVPVRVDGAV